MKRGNGMPKKEKKIKKELFKAIQKRFNHIESSYQMYFNNPYKSEYIHRFRVDMRKLRALLNFLKPMIGEEVYETVNSSLRDLGKKLSPLRDLDTLIAECSEVALNEPDLISNYADVFRFLEKERLKLVKKQSTKKAFRDFNKILKEVKALLQQMTLTLEDAKEDEMEEFVDNRYQHKIKKFRNQYDKLDVSNYEEVHETRKQAKKVRYTSSGFKKVFNKSKRKSIQKEAKTAQSYLGEITDTHVIIEILEEYRDKAPNEKIIESIEKLIKYYTAEAPTV